MQRRGQGFYCGDYGVRFEEGRAKSSLYGQPQIFLLKFDVQTRRCRFQCILTGSTELGISRRASNPSISYRFFYKSYKWF